MATISAGSTIDLVKSIVNEEVKNGMAIIRPLGHHAMKADFNGYCFFNNVALAAKYALDVLKLIRVLIVDWDVHHGQGTQRFFYDDPRVLFFSIHRYELGEFWPHLRESDFDDIGEGRGLGYNFNIPLNQTGMKNEDYLAIFHPLILPVSHEFKPEIVIVSCGFDAAIGCPEGEMLLTPAFYSHMTHSLKTVADGKLAVIMEGGYCVESLAEGAAHILKTLLDDPVPKLVENPGRPNDSIQASILNCIYAHRPYWKCLHVQDTFDIKSVGADNFEVTQEFMGDRTGLPHISKIYNRGIYFD